MQKNVVTYTALKQGGMAQLARANGSYPLGRWFKSNCRYQKKRHYSKKNNVFFFS